ncbi:MAG: oligoribonuclease [Alishewanella agri]|uniref:Oligoribonuclease n=2 Tax=Alishewanella TaxID=111142 RepID=H3ZGQ5_9ALTE|nr:MULTISPECIES: oligoribonuclease [Alishewanella]EHR40233.1 oligoribonuclease [Alishewanella jeotgali KCTC 22429]EJI86397.1 oligoribonuclease [Alishewanella aestuarii B11]MDD4862477.1 oligoribonuclease [Alishewanella agri]
MAVNDTNLIWLDLEMTGLEPKTDVILEMATIVTDSQLNILAEGPVFAIKTADEILDNMDPWCVEQHGKSGLTARCRASTVTLAEAEQQTIAFLSQYVSKGKSPMCGNSIGQDRRFLAEYAPELEAFFHYRNLDVSTVKELARRWHPEVLQKVQKSSSHLALDDIRESIAELVTYRQYFFRLP